MLVVFLRFWQPKRTLNVDLKDITGHARNHHGHSDATIFKAWVPWLVLSLVVFAWGLPRILQLARCQHDRQIRGRRPAQLRSARSAGRRRSPPLKPAIFNFNWLAATGTGILLAAILAGFLMGLGPKSLAAVFAQTVFKIRFTFVTIAAMMAIGYVTRYCGLDATLGLAFARTGAFYTFFGTLIGWLGTASTGSDTSANVLFGSLQTLTARQIGVSPVLMASANAAGGVMGKMIAAPSVVVASTATQTYGQEGSILRFVFLHSLALAALAGICVSLLAYVPVLARPRGATEPRPLFSPLQLTEDVRITARKY